MKDECGGFFSCNYSNVCLLNVAFSYNVTPSAISSYSLCNIIYDVWMKLIIDGMLKWNIDEVVSKKYNDLMDMRIRLIKVIAKHRAFISAMRQHRNPS